MVLYLLYGYSTIVVSCKITSSVRKCGVELFGDSVDGRGEHTKYRSGVGWRPWRARCRCTSVRRARFSFHLSSRMTSPYVRTYVRTYIVHRTYNVSHTTYSHSIACVTYSVQVIVNCFFPRYIRFIIHEHHET